MGHKVSTRAHGRSRTVRERRSAVRTALTAAGVAPAPMLPNYDMTRGEPAERYFLEQALVDGIENFQHDQWPCDTPLLDVTNAEFRGAHGAVFRNPDGSLAHVSLGGGWISVRVAAPNWASIAPVFAAFRAGYPPSYMTQVADARVPITFWANSNFGPTARLRKVDSAAWGDITGNYTSEVEQQLAALMAWNNGPPSKDGGQLVLWQGPPGTGKSWALRALASEWAPWAEFHYITDPDSFFVDDPSYMINVLLADSYEAIDEPTGDIYSEQRDGKWRILILEDTGELLSANAKEKYGQGLSRLLNVVDGMIGQGLKVLALVTTNDELGDLHPAVTRPGRCASQIEFGPLTDAEAVAWTGDADATAGTLAELYAKYGKTQEEALPERDHEDDLEPEEASALMASGMIRVPGTDRFIPRDAFESAIAMVKRARDEDLAADTLANDFRAQVFEVAQAHAEEAVGYGETAWLEEDGAVLYVAGDWTDTDPIAEDFLGIEGVLEFRSEAEALPDGWWDAEVIYPDDPPAWVTVPPQGEEAALADVVALARAPLPPEAEEPELEPMIAAAVAIAEPSPEMQFAHRALDVLEQFASRPADPAPPIHLHLPEHHVVVERQSPDVTVPVTIEAAEPAPINVHLPEQPPAQVLVAAADPAPIVVNVPEQQPAPVHVHVPPAAARSVRVEVDEDGTKRFITEED